MLERLLKVLNVSISFKLYEIIAIIGIFIVFVWLLKQYLNGCYPFEK